MDQGTWTHVTSLEDLPEEELTAVDLDGEAILLFRMGERVTAVGGRCTHQGMPLASGDVDFLGSEPIVTCPAHGSQFRLDDGRVVRSPAQSPLPRYETRVVDGGVEIRASS